MEHLQPKQTVQEYIMEKDAHKMTTELGEYVCLDFDGSLHMIPLAQLGTGNFETVRFARKGCRIRVTYSTSPIADSLVNSIQPDIVKIEVVSQVPELYEVTVRTSFPEQIRQIIAEHGTITQTRRVQ